MANDGTSYENLAVEIYTLLAQRAKEDVTVEGPKVFLDSPDGKREFDVVIRHSILGHPFLTTVECRDRSRKVGLPALEAFSKKIELVGSNKGIIISRIGFSKPAISFAERENIELYVAVDGNSELSEVTGPLLEIPLVVKRIDKIVICPTFQFDGIGIEVQIDQNNFLRPGGRQLYREFREAIANQEIDFAISDQPLNWVPNLTESEKHLNSNEGHRVPIRDYMWTYQILDISIFLGAVHDLPNTISRANILTNDTEVFIFENDVEDKSFLKKFEKLEPDHKLPNGPKVHCINAPDLNFGPFMMVRVD